jgi:non-homologous end joining protein Ku
MLSRSGGVYGRPQPPVLRYPYEVRSADEYFDDIQDAKVTKDMLARIATFHVRTLTTDSG